MSKSPLKIPDGKTVYLGSRRLKGEIPAGLAARLPDGIEDSFKTKKPPATKKAANTE